LDAAAERMTSLCVGTIDEMRDSQLTPVIREIKAAASTLFIDADTDQHQVLIGHLATGGMNASTSKIPKADNLYLITYHDQILHVASSLCTAVADSVSSTTMPSGEVDLRLDIDIAQLPTAINLRTADYFTEAVIKFAATGNLSDIHPLPLDPGHTQLAEALITSIEYFIVGHEYAHIILGHLSDTGPKDDAPTAEVEAIQWDNEFNADAVGLMLALTAAEQFDYATSFAAVGIFFETLDVVDRAVSLLQTGRDSSRNRLGTHPPANLCRQHLQRFLPKVAGVDTRVAEQLDVALQIELRFAAIINALWQQAQPYLIQLHTSGIPASDV
jgi:hypothetical protein